MYCPMCGFEDTRVIDSRLHDGGHKVRRRRECLSCKERFTTYECAEEGFPLIVKSNGTREQYDAQKLRSGILRAIEKRKVRIGAVDKLISEVELQLRERGGREVSSKQLGLWVLEQLKSLDHVAYIRFASVYLSFDSLDAFTRAIAELEQENP